MSCRVSQPHLKTQDFQTQISLLQQSLAILRVVHSDQGLQQIVEVAFDGLARHESVVPRKLAGVVAGSENQVSGLDD